MDVAREKFEGAKSAKDHLHNKLSLLFPSLKSFNDAFIVVSPTLLDKIHNNDNTPLDEEMETLLYVLPQLTAEINTFMWDLVNAYRLYITHEDEERTDIEIIRPSKKVH